jgi:hypothetical protein
MRFCSLSCYMSSPSHLNFIKLVILWSITKIIWGGFSKCTFVNLGAVCMYGGCIFRHHGNGRFTLECVISPRALVKQLPLWWWMGTSSHVIHSNREKANYAVKQNSYGQNCNRNCTLGKELQRPDYIWRSSFMQCNCSYWTDLCQLSWNLGASNSWNPEGQSRPVQGLLYLHRILIELLICML